MSCLYRNDSLAASYRTPPSFFILSTMFLFMKLIIFRSSSVVELSAVNRSVVGSSPTCGAIASIAQQVEHFHGKEEVSGSSPLGSLSKIR